MAKPHTKVCNDENTCQDCLDVARYVGFVREFGVTKALEMVREINKNKQKMEKQLK